MKPVLKYPGAKKTPRPMDRRVYFGTQSMEDLEGDGIVY